LTLGDGAPGAELTDGFAPREVATPATGGASVTLRRLLVGLDVTALAIAWLLTLVAPGVGAVTERSLGTSLAAAGVAVVLGLWLLAAQRLYWARVCSVRTVEITRLAKVALLLGSGALVASDLAGVELRLAEAIIGGGASLAFLLIGRSGYRGWLRDRRREGRYSRPVLLVGLNDEALDMVRLLETHPELGFGVCGVLGDPQDAERLGLSGLWAGTVADTADVLRARHATGAVVVASAVASDELNRSIRELMQAGAHVHITSGLRGFDHRRLRAQPLAYEPIFYLEPVTLSKAQLAVKRAIDLALTSVTLVLASPLLLLAALAIKLDDGGPILFRQHRVGRGGRTFTIFKLRTMVTDAEHRLEALKDRNERQGPLFKLSVDPRVTRVGRLLRACSVDELPQLFNVLRGEMSLVGPRPALPSEAADFDEVLLTRTSVLPGMTGLWQVEARDNSSFATYRRLDLFYVENWSVTLDLVVLLATLESEVARIVRAMLGRPAPATAAS
ncbi:MAG: exopolysaccharide biosynthesis polyprenyl glycosylphosphotransferase, partial [Acidimicrobiia bacterium]|nr:exopolysaccharide biosynthesis polyprenyl glycosylphosphotransferase [Acidimicrobiia bacterium]